MSLVKKRRIDHFRKNKKNMKERVKRIQDQQRKLTAAIKELTKQS